MVHTHILKGQHGIESDQMNLLVLMTRQLSRFHLMVVVDPLARVPDDVPNRC